MASAWSLAVFAVGMVLVAGLARYVRRDAREVGVDSPRRWAAIAAVTPALGFVLSVLVPTIPVPGLLVIVVLGPAVYLLERDDAQHGDAPADPTVLPGAGGKRERSDSEE